MDAFGRALLDYQAGARDQMVRIERDDGFWDAHSPEMYFADQPFEEEASALVGATGPLLDIGAGAGRHLLWAERQGLAATGLDASPGAVVCARARGCSDVVLGDVLRGGLDLQGRSFATATLFGNNIGIGGDWNGTVAMLRAIGAVMAPAGHLLLTSLDVARTDNPTHLAYHARNRAAGKPLGQIKMRVHYKDDSDPWINWFHPQPDELQPLATEAGWEVATLAVGQSGFYWAGLRWNG